MKALASLSKFLGRYDDWLDIVKRHRLKWSKPDNAANVFKSIFDSEGEGKNLDSMVRWIRDVSATLPAEYRNILMFNALTGLRPDEAQKAIYFQHLHDMFTKVSQVMLYIHKAHIKISIDRKHYDATKDANPAPVNGAKVFRQRIGQAQDPSNVKYSISPNGTVMTYVGCSDSPFLIREEEDVP
jgi:hypothetical protein